MTNSSPFVNLKFGNINIEELRELAVQHLGKSVDEVSQLDKNAMLSLLTTAIKTNSSLAEAIGTSEIAIKPSFYLMNFVSDGAKSSNPKERFENTLKVINFELTENKESPNIKEFVVDTFSDENNKIVEILLSWQKIHWYWTPDDFSKKFLYEAQFGIVIIDFNSNKALIVCHTQIERDYIAKAIKEAFSITLSPLVLTQEILDQIGNFSTVKRASYFNPQANADTPSNITYADEKLGAKYLALNEEKNPKSQRKLSFYRIPLGSVKEHGIGATSDSGKLWIPRETPLPTIRDFGIELLSKISQELNRMVKSGKISKALEVLNLAGLPMISDITPVALRKEVINLLEQIINMLLNGENERAFTVSTTLVTSGMSSNLFMPPRLRLVGSESGEIGYWSNKDKTSSLITFSKNRDDITVKEYPSRKVLDLENIIHPITGNIVEIRKPLEFVEIIPEQSLLEILLEGIKYIAESDSNFSKLKNVIFLPFRLSQNLIHLDTKRAFGEANANHLTTEIAPIEIREMQQAMQQTIDPNERGRLKDELIELGEKCTSMNDDNCQTCIQDEKFICLRSLVGRYMNKSLILAHKGIELSDIQGKGDIEGKTLTIFGFAKLAESKSEGLTARNKAGAILTAQVLGQIDKTTFDTVMIISPATINEDIGERLKLICDYFGKKLVLLNQEALAKMLVHFKEQLSFDGKDYDLMLENSKKKDDTKKKAKSKRKPTH